jgi:hypothetical protein
MTEKLTSLQFFKQEIERLLASKEYMAVNEKNLTDEDEDLLDKIIGVLVARYSPDDGLTLNQLAQRINEPDSYKVQRALQLLKSLMLYQLTKSVVGEKGPIKIAIFPLYSEKVKDSVFFNGAGGDKEYVDGFLKYLGFNTLDKKNNAYYFTKNGGIINLGSKEDVDDDVIIKDREADYDDGIENLKGNYTEEQGFDEILYLAEGIMNLLKQNENPKRNQIIINLILQQQRQERQQNAAIPEWIETKTELELARILLPGSRNEISPEALEPYVNKIKDALYLLSKTNIFRK